MAVNKLTALQIKNAKGPRLLSDGGNLYLNVTASSTKSWLFIYKREDEAGGKPKRTELGLGPAHIVPAPDARERRDTYNRELYAGRDPRALHFKMKRSGAGAITFGKCAEDFIAKNEPAWRNAKHVAQWRMTLSKYAGPFWLTPVADVSTADILKVLSPLWSTKPETASRLRGRIEAVLDAAKAQGLRSGDNPAAWKGHLAAILPKRARLTRGHHAAMAIDALPQFMAHLREQSGAAARALEFAILTGARSGEVLGARWSEIANETWTVPANRMKGGRVHRVPLSKAALAVTVEVQLMKDGPEGETVASRLRQVEVGIDEDGEPITSLVVDAAEATRSSKQTARRPSTKAARIALSALAEAIDAEGKPPPQGVVEIPPSISRTVTKAQWRAMAAKRGISTSDKYSAVKNSLDRATVSLVGDRFVGVWEDHVWPT